MASKNKRNKNSNTSGIRIQKYLSSMGYASRRAVEEMIEQGLVEVNGNMVKQMPCFIDPDSDEITVAGSRVRIRKTTRHVYYLVNKPKGVICTSDDPEGRPKITDMIPRSKKSERVYCVGRLDADSTGLVLLTNDGELTNRLTHPRYGVDKTYLVNVPEKIDGRDIEKILSGQYLDGRNVRPTSIRIVRKTRTSTLLEITLREGKNREIRRLLAKRGYSVRRLRRVAIGSVTDRGLKTGNYRVLDPREVRQLKNCGR
jgi:23S rRNA pseudouridine2605 synthase